VIEVKHVTVKGYDKCSYVSISGVFNIDVSLTSQFQCG